MTEIECTRTLRCVALRSTRCPLQKKHHLAKPKKDWLGMLLFCLLAAAQFHQRKLICIYYLKRQVLAKFGLLSQATTPAISHDKGGAMLAWPISE
jgi:hypothetical protein